MTTSRTHKTFDVELQLKDAGLVAASAAAQVGGSDQILDLGTGLVEGDLVVDTTAVEVASGDEGYDIEFQGSSSPTFATVDAVLAVLKLGDTTKTNEAADSPASGHYVVPVRNEKNGTHLQYARLYTRVSGTVATGINYSAYLGKK